MKMSILTHLIIFFPIFIAMNPVQGAQYSDDVERIRTSLKLCISASNPPINQIQRILDKCEEEGRFVDDASIPYSVYKELVESGHSPQSKRSSKRYSPNNPGLQRIFANELFYALNDVDTDEGWTDDQLKDYKPIDINTLRRYDPTKDAEENYV